MAVNGCAVCLEKQRRIDEPVEEVKRLRVKVRYQERKEQEGFFGFSRPSSAYVLPRISERLHPRRFSP